MTDNGCFDDALQTDNSGIDAYALSGMMYGLTGEMPDEKSFELGMFLSEED